MFTQPVAKLYCPLTWLSFAIDYRVWGRDPFGYHLTNLVLHAANVWLLIVLLWKLPVLKQFPERVRLWAAVLAGALYGVHPLRVESVAWVTERKDVLFAFFYLLGLLAYLRWMRLGRRRALAVSFVCATASALSKSAGVTFPVVVLLLDWMHGRRFQWLNKIPFVLVSVAVGVATILSQTSGDVETLSSLEIIPVWGRMGLVGYCSLFYVVKTIWPFQLNAIYPVYEELGWTWPVALAHFVALVVVTGICVAARKRAPLILPAWLLYLVTLSPTIGIAPVGIHIVADRYAYLPSMILSAILALPLISITYRGGWKTAVPVALVSAAILWGLSVLTIERTKVWQNSGALFQSVLLTNPDNLPAHANLTLWHMNNGELDKAIEHGEHAVRVAPKSGYALKNLAFAYIKAGRHRDAIRILREPAEKQINDPKLWRALAESFEAIGETNNAAAARLRYEALSPSR